VPAVLDTSLAPPLSFLHRLLLLLVQVAEVQTPDNDLLFRDFVPEPVERVAQFLGYP